MTSVHMGRVTVWGSVICEGECDSVRESVI